MLNKIWISGRVVAPRQSNDIESNNDRMNDHIMSNVEMGVKYFSLSVPSPNRSVTKLRCMLTQPENVERWNREIEREDIVRVKGYIRNEKGTRQNLIKVVEWTKLDVDYSELEKMPCNCVRLLGKIITDFDKVDTNYRLNSDPEVVNFKMLVWQGTDENNSYFCRVSKKELVKKRLKKGDVVIVQGFLQTKTNKKMNFNGESEESGINLEYNCNQNFPHSNVFRDENRTIFERASSINCQEIMVLDNNDPVNDFGPLGADIIKIPTKLIDFDVPK